MLLLRHPVKLVVGTICTLSGIWPIAALMFALTAIEEWQSVNPVTALTQAGLTSENVGAFSVYLTEKYGSMPDKIDTEDTKKLLRLMAGGE